jgi:hypothetical protein
MATHVEVGASRSQSNLSDEALIEKFVDGFLQGHVSLLSNQKLRTEPLFDSMQLLASREGVLATAKVKAAPIGMIVRRTSSYWELLHQALLAQSFYPLMPAPQEGCYIYRFVEEPAGYELHCTTAKELWRACWGRGYSMRSGIPLDLLVWRQGPAGSKENWYSLRGMDCEQGQLMVKMLGWSTTIDSGELIVWAKQTTATRRGVSSPASSLRQRVPFRQ